MYQLCEYKELDLKIAPAEKNCAEVLQRWNIPEEVQNSEAILFLKENLVLDLVFEKADAEKDQLKKEF